jgi:hypothetical protein
LAFAAASPFVRKADNLTLATGHLAQSSSASRVIAAQAGFFILILAGFYSRRQLLANAAIAASRVAS